MTGLAEVVRLLDVEQVDAHLFRGGQPLARPPRVFGGQVLAQGLRAAGTTAPAGRLPHSLHAYFLRPGHTNSRIVYSVVVLRDGGTLSVRRVVAIQDGAILCELTASFAAEGAATSGGNARPLAPQPTELDGVQQRLSAYADELDGWWVRDRPFDLRPVGPPPRAALDELDQPARHSQLWLRADGAVPDDPLLHSCLLAYASDMTLLEPVLISRRRTTLGPGSVASLDHAMWFHRRPNVTDWLFYDTKVLGDAATRGLAGGQIFTQGGDLVCTVAQEGYLSSHAPRAWAGPRLLDGSAPGAIPAGRESC